MISVAETDIIQDGALAGIRYRIYNLNGALFIEIRENFKITVLIPKE